MRSRHALATVVFVAIAAGSLAAQQARTTFVLTDGERLTGSVVNSADTRTRVRGRSEFHLRAQDGTDVPVPVEQVAIIQFVGGLPLEEEILAAPSNGHLLSLRNGDLRQGQLVGFVGGTTLRWANPRGGIVDVPVSQVRRIVLNGDRARELYNIGAASVDSGSAWSSDAPRRNRRAARSNAIGAIELGRVTVRSTTAWTDGGLTVQAGDILLFDPSGQIAFSRNPDHVATPEGHGAREGREQGLPVETALVGALIGKVGPRGRPFPIGAGEQDIEMPANGRLYLGVNDDGLDDNSGSFRVVIYR